MPLIHLIAIKSQVNKMTLIIQVSDHSVHAYTHILITKCLMCKTEWSETQILEVFQIQSS